MNNPRPEIPAARPTPATTDPPPTATALDAAALAGTASPETEVPRNPLPKIIPFDGLARCGDEVWIENAGQIYRLRRTRQGKLILTK